MFLRTCLLEFVHAHRRPSPDPSCFFVNPQFCCQVAHASPHVQRVFSPVAFSSSRAIGLISFSVRY